MFKLVRQAIDSVRMERCLSMTNVSIIFGNSIATHKYKKLFVIKENGEHHLCCEADGANTNIFNCMSMSFGINNANFDMLDNSTFAFMFSNSHPRHYIDILDGTARILDTDSSPQYIDSIVSISDDDIRRRNITLTVDKILNGLSECDRVGVKVQQLQ